MPGLRKLISDNSMPNGGPDEEYKAWLELGVQSLFSTLFTMKFTSLGFVVLVAGSTWGSPTLDKRAVTSDKATIGYATLSGG
jgi:hypothetical protein